jgi:hypothetical protein
VAPSWQTKNGAVRQLVGWGRSGTSSWGRAPPLSHHPGGRWRIWVGVLTVTLSPAQRTNLTPLPRDISPRPAKLWWKHQRECRGDAQETCITEVPINPVSPPLPPPLPKGPPIPAPRVVFTGNSPPRVRAYLARGEHEQRHRAQRERTAGGVGT